MGQLQILILHLSLYGMIYKAFTEYNEVKWNICNEIFRKSWAQLYT